MKLENLDNESIFQKEEVGIERGLEENEVKKFKKVYGFEKRHNEGTFNELLPIVPDDIRFDFN